MLLQQIYIINKGLYNGCFISKFLFCYRSHSTKKAQDVQAQQVLKVQESSAQQIQQT